MSIARVWGGQESPVTNTQDVEFFVSPACLSSQMTWLVDGHTCAGDATGVISEKPGERARCGVRCEWVLGITPDADEVEHYRPIAGSRFGVRHTWRQPERGKTNALVMRVNSTAKFYSLFIVQSEARYPSYFLFLVNWSLLVLLICLDAGGRLDRERGGKSARMDAGGWVELGRAEIDGREGPRSEASGWQGGGRAGMAERTAIGSSAHGAAKEAGAGPWRGAERDHEEMFIANKASMPEKEGHAAIGIVTYDCKGIRGDRKRRPGI
ncbi:hypothetical protein BOTBODRAFT_141880 [Botryobasidium botryosum FD-172 SS1]|uniref:Uncharacterized protein n=1 Tax=Botryobasidium botryosum (strain FD-172 SS1) TaxID=930990 RepID=A0A067N1H9_BOTB1|nr:hypothetical protein BOTBODRAFT_141880 [Botryobasidium botryosum FD-172 SS1]